MESANRFRGSIVAAALIFLISYWYNSKRQSDAEANEYTRLINEIANLNSKFAILDSKIDIELNTSAIKNQTNDINNLTTIIHDLQMIMLKDVDDKQVVS